MGVLDDYIERFIQIESGGDPNAKTGKYTGLLQMGPDERAKYGGDSLEAGKAMLADKVKSFQAKYGREPTGGELYLIHQQGETGAAAHLANPESVAWKTVRPYYPSDAVAKAAIWGNVPDQVKRQFPGGVDSVTSKDFANYWISRIEGAPPAPRIDASGSPIVPKTPSTTPPPLDWLGQAVAQAASEQKSPLPAFSFSVSGGKPPPTPAPPPLAVPQAAPPQFQQFPAIRWAGLLPRIL